MCVAADAHVTAQPLLKVSGATLQVLKGHMSLALADAQSVTVLRAVQKGNAPNLIAGLANETTLLYQSAARYLTHALPGSQSSKSSAYADWKALVFQAYAFAHAGEPHQYQQTWLSRVIAKHCIASCSHV